MIKVKRITLIFLNMVRYNIDEKSRISLIFAKYSTFLEAISASG